MGDYSGPGGGISPPAGDIGGTTADPTVVSTHLTSPLPLAQGGSGVDGATTQANFPGGLGIIPTSGAGLLQVGYGGSAIGNIEGLNNGIYFQVAGNSNNNWSLTSTGTTYSVASGQTHTFQNGIVNVPGQATNDPVYTTADVVSGTALQISTTRDAIVSLDITYSTSLANTILVQTGPTSTPANTVYKKVKTTTTAEEDTVLVDVKAGEYLLVTLTNATFTNATQVVKEV